MSKKGTDFSFGNSNYKSIATCDYAQNALPKDKKDYWIKTFIEKRQIDINNRYKDNSEGFRKAFTKTFTENFSKVFFFLLPVFCFGVETTLSSKDFFYSEHLVFSIDYYNFFFIAGSVYMIFEFITFAEYLTFLIEILIGVYLLLAMKRMAGQGWIKTIFKYTALIFIFGFSLGIGLLINLAVTLLSI